MGGLISYNSGGKKDKNVVVVRVIVVGGVFVKREAGGDGDWAVNFVISEVIQLYFVISGYITIGWLLNLGALLTVFHILCGYTDWMYFFLMGVCQLDDY